MSATKSALSPVRQIAAHELVVDQMRRALELGQFRIGDRLPTERELADLLDVSRTTVRTAVAVLEREGLIAVRRGRGGGYTVRAPEYDPVQMRHDLRRNTRVIREAFEYRLVVETGAARMAAERRRATDLADLRKLLAGMEVALRRALDEESARRTNEFHTLDSAFHLRIAQAARNDRLLDAVADSRRRTWPPVTAVFGRLEPGANADHQEILAAIEEREPELAADRMALHINDTRRTVESLLRWND
ncbi:FadR/GntR family transcriptional regulator [Mycobacterium sp. NPDC003449]